MGAHGPRRQDPFGGLLNQTDGAAPKRGAFFGRRKGHKLRKQQAALYDTLLPRLALNLSAPAPRDLKSLFPKPPQSVRLEIGFGGGEHLLHEARTNPLTGFIGCEPFINGMAKALALIEAEQLSNIRLHPGDALDLLEWLPALALERVDLLYADPWPKRRHWKRRFVSDENIARFARVIEPGGTLRFASDIESYVEWTLICFLRARDFTWTAERADDWRLAWKGFPGTRYEAKALKRGAKPAYLAFQRA